MTATSVSVAPINTNATTFRAWGSAISAALAALGFVQTADTGQINWATVAAPTASGQVMGYEVWRFADSLQSTAPIFFKIQYGSNGGAASQPQMTFTVGTGSNGSGTITGTDISGVTGALTTGIGAMPQAVSSGASSSAQTIYLNSDGSALVIASVSTNPNTVSAWGFVLVIERTRTWAGAATGDGFVLMRGETSTGGGFTQTWPISYIPGQPQVAAASGSGWLAVTQGGSATWTTTILAGTTLNPIPVLTGTGVKASGPSQFLMAYVGSDYPADRSVTMNHYGVSRTWRTGGLGNRGASGAWGTTVPYTGVNSFMVRID